MMLPGLAPELLADGAAGVEWYTPKWLLDWLPPIALDPCWSAASLVRAAAVIDLRRGEDGLTTPWEPIGAGVVFCNPPFDNTCSWLRRCRQESARTGRVVVALVPAYPGDGPWHSEVWPHAALVGWIAGRMQFRDPQGRTEQKGRGHALILYGPTGGAVEDVAYVIKARSLHHPQAPVWVRRFEP